MLRSRRNIMMASARGVSPRWGNRIDSENPVAVAPTVCFGGVDSGPVLTTKATGAAGPSLCADADDGVGDYGCDKGTDADHNR